MKHKVNKGEWAELYVFLSVLATGKLYAADEDLNKIEEAYYTVLQAIKIEENEEKRYSRDTKKNLVVIYSNGTKKISIPIADFLNFGPIVLEGIKNGTGRSFEIPEIEEFLEQILVDKIKASSDSKKDLIFQVHDEFTGFKPQIGFSVKSYIGGAPTLINSSGATVFSYTTEGNLVTEQFVNTINQIESRNKIKDRIEHIYTHGITLKYIGLSSNIFSRNLQMIDFRLPEILANLYLSSYFVSGKKMTDVVKYYVKKYNEDEQLIEYKIKDLLTAAALGMEPNTHWDGLEDANGGYIVVKSDGEILCYHIYDRNKLRTYLYNHTKFDTPSTGRTGSGLLEFNKNTSEATFKLSLQVRFS
ncbi:HpaII family restriction endonuclease [Vagococcus sp. PNs007]|uniref:HpaII family restriction endonuclease n=1 Tax=Vagococcus proximus TaxID=2991417 RepID=A0ABT5X0X5_9ENTE|nr:HpaII family restriction endonuclease [Vagococcus proximus]MDF0479653.1 HpaII family restriction endonuclease [Vagococcus proximus]